MSRDKINKKDKMSDLCPSTYTRFRLLTERQIRDKLGTNQGQIRDKLGTNQGCFIKGKHGIIGGIKKRHIVAFI